MKNLLKVFIFIFLFLSAISCSNDNDNNDDNIDISEKGYLKTVYKNGNIIKEYSYFDNGKIKTERFFQKDFEYKYSLDTVYKVRINCTDGIVNCTNINKFFKENENSIIKKEITEFGTLYASSKYVFNNDCSYILIKEYNSLGNLDYKIEYQYDTNCGYSRTVYDEANNIVFRKIVTKDDNIAFNQKNSIPLLIEDNKHNITKLEYITSSGNIYDGFSYNESFVFDTNGFPISSSRIYYDGDIENYTYDYY